nr:MAG TPA: hypothetical protein [Caudoviricetes sp.]
MKIAKGREYLQKMCNPLETLRKNSGAGCGRRVTR